MPRRQRTLRIEQMEARQMMAGDVAASVVGGTLYLNEASGQAGLDNSVVVSQLSPGRIRVSSNSTSDGSSSLINGAAFQDFNVTGGLSVNFGAGNDLVVFDQLNPVKFTNVNINMGAPPPVVSQFAKVGVDTTLNPPDKDNVIMWGAEITGSLTVNTGDGNDWVYIANTPIGGNATINTGAGADTAQLKNLPGLIGGAVDIQLYTSLSEKDGDVAWLERVYANGNINIRGGDGDDILHLDNVTAYQDFNLDAGAGNDRLEADDVCAVDDLFARLSDGNDSADLRNLYVIHGRTQIDGGNGSDSLTKSGAFPTAQLTQTGFEWINGRLVFLGNASVNQAVMSRA